MVCGRIHCDERATRLVIAMVVDTEYHIPRCDDCTSRNDSFVPIEKGTR